MTVSLDAPGTLAEESFLFDVAGRVRNVSLPPSNINSLIPLFEAVSNSIHAVEFQYGEEFGKLGKIQIEIFRVGDVEDGNILGFKILDNGIGLNENNWKSFRTSDSVHKHSRGGKGVGRLSWLKAFASCTVVSRFLQDGGVFKRSFSFKLGSGNPIQQHKVEQESSTKQPGTEVFLSPFHSAFGSACPKKTETIAAKLVGHFLRYFVVDKCPQIVLVDGTTRIDLGQYYSKHQERNDVEAVPLRLTHVEEEQEFHIYHVLLKKQLRFHESGGIHWLFFSGNERVVHQEAIDGQIGLKYIGDESDCVYVGLVAGPFLDSHVNQERTGFSVESQQMADIHKTVIARTKIFLKSYIDVVREAQLATTRTVIRENPQFLPFRENLPEFIQANLSLSTQGEEDIYVELSRRKLRLKRRLLGQLKSLGKEADEDTFDAEVKNIAKALNDEKKGALAEYVVRRKEVLDLFSSSLAYQDVDTRRHYREDVLHELIIPLRTSSDDLDYTQHNLWLLDDRLAFYTYFKSDLGIAGYVEGSDSNKEPDLAVVFDQALAFQRDGRDEPIVIVEFKRPGRDNYDGNSNPVSQVLNYVDEFRAGSAVKGKDGRVIKPINPATRFICFVIADFTDSLVKVVRTSPANNPTADGQGFFGISREHNASIEVLPYEKLVHDARLRNEAFFRHLGLI